VADASGRLAFREGALVTAVRRGHWVVLDELNLAPSDVLEALNRCDRVFQLRVRACGVDLVGALGGGPVCMHACVCVSMHVHALLWCTPACFSASCQSPAALRFC